MKILKRLLCLHLQWERAISPSKPLLPYQKELECLDCGKRIVRNNWEYPVNYYERIK